MTINIENLTKLADFLESEVKDDQFDISEYRRSEFGDVRDFKCIGDCGTIGCALGWLPFVIKPHLSDFNSNMNLDFNRFSQRPLS